MSKLIDSFTEEQKEDVEILKKEWLTNEIDRITFNTDTFARYLSASDFDIDKAATLFSDMLHWRRENHVNAITDSEANDEIEEDILNYLPHGWHQVDKKGHPVFYVHIGEAQIKSLMTWIKKVEVLVTYFINILEETIREKFYKWNTDQLLLVLDLNGIKIKQASL